MERFRMTRELEETHGLGRVLNCVEGKIEYTQGSMILVVDDDVLFLERASKILNRDRQVFLATDSKQAFELAEDLGFSVALVDLDLKGRAGLSLIQELREGFPDLPIIAISAVLHGPELDSARELGVVEILQKPITSDWKSVVERVRATKAH
jgi:CheY-like chemotaxis protein